MVFYPSVDPRIKGFFGDNDLKDLEPIKPETVKSWEFGYKGRISQRMFATLDLYTSHYSSFISGATFITPIILQILYAKISVRENVCYILFRIQRNQMEYKR